MVNDVLAWYLSGGTEEKHTKSVKIFSSWLEFELQHPKRQLAM
jgi:hypothetical protein